MKTFVVIASDKHGATVCGFIEMFQFLTLARSGL